MAFGIDEVLTAATSGIKLLSTVSKTVEKYRKKGDNIDLALLLDEVKLAAIARIDDMDLSLAQFERTVVETNVPLDIPLSDVIAKTPFWQPHISLRLKQIHKKCNAFSDSIYSATDDIAALVRCQQNQYEMGSAIVETTRAKHLFQERMLNSKSLKESIGILREELAKQKQALMQSDGSSANS